MAEEIEVCKTCRYMANGFCHRYPPVVIDEDSFIRPIIIADEDLNWCGEWVKK